MKFIHAADLHLGSVIGLPAFGTTDPALLLWQAYDRLIDLCLSEKIDFLLLAGDTFDTDRVSQVTRKRFTDGMARLAGEGINVCLIHGNHDPQTPELAFLQQIDGLHVFDAAAASTQHLSDLGVAIHGQSFVKGPINQNLSLDYPAPTAGYYNIGMLHTSLSQDGDHARYAPCSVANLVDKNYDYWALGHIHKPQVFSEKPWVGFCGNLQGRHIREEGARGINLVHVQQAETRVEPRTLSGAEFANLRIDLGSDDTFDSVVSQCAKLVDAQDETPRALRLYVAGQAAVIAGLFDRQYELLSGINDHSVAVQRGTAYVKDLKFKTTTEQAALNLPFDLDFSLDEGLFDTIQKTLKGKGLALPPLTDGELEEFVQASLGNLSGGQ